MFARSIGVLCAGALVSSASAEAIEITFENLLPSGSPAFTPVFFGLHDGGFDLFDSGTPASAALELVAELGDTSMLSAEFVATPGTGPSGTAAGPVLGGGSTLITFDPADPTSSRYLTFATMVVPSNDLFIGNGNPMGIEIFDAGGSFVGPITIDIFGADVWDAGTEMNDALDGAAFLQGVDGTRGTPEGGVVQLFFDQPDAVAYLDSLVGLTTAPGFVIEQTFGEMTPIARITIIPAPGAVCIFLLAALGTTRRRRHS
jgi:hypothetical protein